MFSFTPTGLEYGVEGFDTIAFFLLAAAGFLSVRRVTSFYSSLTTSGSFFDLHLRPLT